MIVTSSVVYLNNYLHILDVHIVIAMHAMIALVYFTDRTMTYGLD